MTPRRRLPGRAPALVVALTLLVAAAALADCGGSAAPWAARAAGTLPTRPTSSTVPAPSGSVPSGAPTTVPTPVAAVPGWSTPLTAIPPGGGFTSVSCLSDTYCIAAGGGDNQADADQTAGAGVTDSWDGAAWADPSVYFPAPSSGTPSAPIMPALNCTDGPLCVIVDGTGHASTGDGTNWSAPAALAGTQPSSTGPADPGPGHPGSRHAAVACSDPSFCAAVDNTGRVAVLQSGHWSGLTPLGPAGLYVAGPVGLSCPESSACLAVVGTATFGWDGSGWHPEAPWTSAAGAGGGGAALSCPETSLCWVVSGSVAAEWTNGVWSAPVTVDPSAALDGVSCPTTTFCAGVDASGSVVTWNGTGWSAPQRVLPAPTIYTGDPSSVSCPSAGFCMVLDGDGDYSTYHGTAGGAASSGAPS